MPFGDHEGLQYSAETEEPMIGRAEMHDLLVPISVGPLASLCVAPRTVPRQNDSPTVNST